MATRIVPIAEEHIEGFRRCLDEVARERRHLAHTEAPPLESVRSFVMENIKRNYAQFVALAGDRVVGWADILPQTWEGCEHVGELGMGVVANRRGQGIGSQLLSATVEGARERGLERVELQVYASNTPACSLYESYGFVKEGVKVNARKLDGEYDDIVLMALFL